MTKTLAINLDARHTTVILTVIMLVLVTAHILVMQANNNESLGLKDAWGFEYWQIAIFDLDEEESFGTWFSSVILLFSALLLIYVARYLRSVADAMFRWWMTLGLGFGLMSIDEVVGLHELINTLYEDVPWTTFGFYIVVITGIGYMPFLWRYRGRTSALFLIAGAIYVLGAVGVEHYSGSDLNSLGYNMLTALEEGLEMSGVILVIYAILEFINTIDADQ